MIDLLPLAAQAKLVSVVNGHVDAYYAPPDAIREFARLIVAECADRVEALGAQGYGSLAIAAQLRRPE